jgi:hypothetical protein
MSEEHWSQRLPMEDVIEPDLIYEDLVVGYASNTPIYARRGTFNRAIQHLYPTAQNGLEFDLEAPYAHSLSAGVRYWTRDDALFDIRWNALARPPCLNCLVSDNRSLARRCDRYRQQEITFGMARCCSNCQKSGQSQACVELIEVSTAHLFDPLPGASLSKEVRIYESLRPQSQRFVGFQDIGMWGRTAHGQRAKGLVAWRPINLALGDPGSKAEVVSQYRERTEAMGFLLEPVRHPGEPREGQALFLSGSRGPCVWRLKRARSIVRVWDLIDEQLSESSETEESLVAGSDSSSESAESSDESDHTSFSA